MESNGVMQEPRKVWIIYPAGGFLLIPSLAGLVLGLADRGFLVDLFVEPGPDGSLPAFEQPAVRVVPLSRSIATTAWQRLRRAWTTWAWRLACARMRGRPRCIVAVDLWGVFLAMIAAPWSSRCIIYLNLEIRILGELAGRAGRSKLLFKRIEAFANRRCRATLIQDELRAAALVQEHRLGSQPVLLLPNSPPGRARLSCSTYLRDQFGIDPGCAIVLYMGTLAPQLMPVEFVQAAATWPSHLALVIHAPMAEADDPHAREIIRLIKAAPGRCFFSDRFLDSATLEDLVASADMGVCLCRPVPGNEQNEELMGKSSGKVALYLKAGVPVVASRLESLAWIERAGCGALVGEPDQFVAAADRILAHQDAFAAAAVRTFDSQLSLDPALDRLADFIRGEGG